MGLFYPDLVPNTLIGTKSGTTQTPATLTAAASGNIKAFETADYSVVVFDVYYTTGATETNNVINVVAEASTDGTNWAQLTNESSSSGTSTLYPRTWSVTGASAGTAYPFSYRLDISYKYMRISAYETGVVSNYGAVFIEATLAGR
jgi:hypothetical protein